MKDILIVTHFTQAPNEQGNGRFHYIANKLTDNEENQIEIVTTSFSHRYKRKRIITNEELNGVCYKFTMVDEPEYPKNVCLKRFYSHYIMSRNLEKYLKSRRKPDVIYCAIPSLDVAKVAAKYARKNDIRFIIDVQDLWPEAFEMVFHVPVLSGLLFAPMKRQADYAYRQADEIVAVSETYLNRALKVNKKCNRGHVVFLGTELETFDNNKHTDIKWSKENTELWLGYCGTLGSSYDLICVIDALRIIQDKGLTVPKFVVMGDGPRRKEFEDYGRERGVACLFTGSLPYQQMCALLVKCDMVVNPITHAAAQSIINKHADYAASGLPVLNTQECEEYRELVAEYNMGFNCNNNDAKDLADKMVLLINNPILRREMGCNARRCAEEKFDRGKSYQKIVKRIICK